MGAKSSKASSSSDGVGSPGGVAGSPSTSSAMAADASLKRKAEAELARIAKEFKRYKPNVKQFIGKASEFVGHGRWTMRHVDDSLEKFVEFQASLWQSIQQAEAIVPGSSNSVRRTQRTLVRDLKKALGALESKWIELHTVAMPASFAMRVNSYRWYVLAPTMSPEQQARTLRELENATADDVDTSSFSENTRTPPLRRNASAPGQRESPAGRPKAPQLNLARLGEQTPDGSPASLASNGSQSARRRRSSLSPIDEVPPPSDPSVASNGNGHGHGATVGQISPTQSSSSLRMLVIPGMQPRGGGQQLQPQQREQRTVSAAAATEHERERAVAASTSSAPGVPPSGSTTPPRRKFSAPPMPTIIAPAPAAPNSTGNSDSSGVHANPLAEISTPRRRRPSAVSTTARPDLASLPQLSGPTLAQLPLSPTADASLNTSALDMTR